MYLHNKTYFSLTLCSACTYAQRLAIILYSLILLGVLFLPHLQCVLILLKRLSPNGNEIEQICIAQEGHLQQPVIEKKIIEQ